MSVETIEKILIVMDEGIGNMIRLTPAIRAIKQLMPGAVTVFGRQPSVQVINGSPFVNKVLTEPDDDYYDVGFLALWFNSYAVRFADAIKKSCRKLYRIENADVTITEQDQYMTIPRFLGFESQTPAPFYVEREADIRFPSGKPVVGICDTSASDEHWKRKRWPFFKELAQLLVSDGYSVALIGGETELREFDSSEWPPVINCLGRFDIPETINVLKRCTVVVGNDSGPVHLAAAAGAKTIALFGSTFLPKNHPLGESCIVIYRDMDCSPCQYTDRWDACSDWQCINSIAVDEVFQTIEGVVEG